MMNTGEPDWDYFSILECLPLILVSRLRMTQEVLSSWKNIVSSSVRSKFAKDRNRKSKYLNLFPSLHQDGEAARQEAEFMPWEGETKLCWQELGSEWALRALCLCHCLVWAPWFCWHSRLFLCFSGLCICYWKVIWVMHGWKEDILSQNLLYYVHFF